MKISDLIEIACINLKKQKNYKKTVFFMLGIIFIVFNLTFSLSKELITSNTEKIIDNSNYKIIEVETPNEYISEDTLKNINNIEGVSIAFYNNLISITLENYNTEEDVSAIGLTNLEYSKFLGSDINLNDNKIVLNNKYKEKGVKIGDLIECHYSTKVSHNQGEREYLILEVGGFYEQPNISYWPENVVIISKEKQNEIYSKFYGIDISEIEESKVLKQSVITLVDNIDSIDSISKTIEGLQLITYYSFKGNNEIPLIAKATIGIGITILIILMIMSVIIIDLTINASIKKRNKEIGIFKTIGFSENNIFKFLLIEIIILWGKVCIIATLISAIMFFIINKIFEFNSILIVNINLSISQIFISSTIILSILFLSTIRVILSVSRLKVIEVLRDEY